MTNAIKSDTPRERDRPEHKSGLKSTAAEAIAAVLFNRFGDRPEGAGPFGGEDDGATLSSIEIELITREILASLDKSGLALCSKAGQDRK
jgi:hypothetical protein